MRRLTVASLLLVLVTFVLVDSQQDNERTDCESGTYGEDCQERCSEHCRRANIEGVEMSTCDPVTGACNFGCEDGYAEPLCLESRQKPPQPDVGMWIGIGIGICVLLFGVVVFVAVYCHRRRLHNIKCGPQPLPGYDKTDFTRQDDQIKYKGIYI